MLRLLDLSSAFDTIHHSIQEHYLHTDFGYTDTVLQWFSSYQTDHTQHISLFMYCSAFVPRGSILGPAYIKPLFTIIVSHSIMRHSFADSLAICESKKHLENSFFVLPLSQHHTAPSYVTDMLQKSHHTPTTFPPVHTQWPLSNRPSDSAPTLSGHLFSSVSFSFWNSIPCDVRCGT